MAPDVRPQNPFLEAEQTSKTFHAQELQGDSSSLKQKPITIGYFCRIGNHPACDGRCPEYQDIPSCVCSCHPPEIQGTLKDRIAAQYPHGHPEFNEMMLELMKLHSDKNKGYAGGGSTLGNFERCAAIMKLYPNFPVDSPAGIAALFALKHFDRIMWDMSRHLAPSDECLSDEAVYRVIMRCMNADRKAEYAQSQKDPNR